MRHEVYEGRFRLEPKELIDGGDKVLVLIRSSGRAKSASEISGHIWGVWTFREAKPVRWTDFGSHRSEALEAVGLSEQEARAD